MTAVLLVPPMVEKWVVRRADWKGSLWVVGLVDNSGLKSAALKAASMAALMAA